MSLKSYWKKGDWNAICESCGFQFKASELQERWDGLYVCKDDWEVRHPLDFIRAVKDDSSVPWSSPDSDDTSSLTYPNYLSVDGSLGSFAHTRSSTKNSITGDLDIRIKASLTDWTPSVASVLVSKWHIDLGIRSYRVFIRDTTGVLVFQGTGDGAGGAGQSLDADSTAAPSITNGTALWLRVTLDVNNGSGSYVVKFYTSTEITKDVTAVTWTQLGSTVTTANSPGSIYNSSVALEIGSSTLGTDQVTIGKIYYADIRSGIDGDIAVKFNPQECSLLQNGFISSSGEFWNICGTARIINT